MKKQIISIVLTAIITLFSTNTPLLSADRPLRLSPSQKRQQKVKEQQAKALRAGRDRRVAQAEQRRKELREQKLAALRSGGVFKRALDQALEALPALFTTGEAIYGRLQEQQKRHGRTLRQTKDMFLRHNRIIAGHFGHLTKCLFAYKNSLEDQVAIDDKDLQALAGSINNLVSFLTDKKDCPAYVRTITNFIEKLKTIGFSFDLGWCCGGTPDDLGMDFGDADTGDLTDVPVKDVTIVEIPTSMPTPTPSFLERNKKMLIKCAIAAGIVTTTIAIVALTPAGPVLVQQVIERACIGALSGAALGAPIGALRSLFVGERDPHRVLTSAADEAVHGAATGAVLGAVSAAASAAYYASTAPAAPDMLALPASTGSVLPPSTETFSAGGSVLQRPDAFVEAAQTVPMPTYTPSAPPLALPAPSMPAPAPTAPVAPVAIPFGHELQCLGQRFVDKVRWSWSAIPDLTLNVFQPLYDRLTGHGSPISCGS